MKKEVNIATGAFFSLFIISYTPLFTILIFRQLITYKEYLNWGGINQFSIYIFLKYFGFITILLFSIIFSIVGINIFLNNIDKRTRTSGENIIITEIENKNSESITYLFTYIIPFIFQDLSKMIDVVSIMILLIVTYCIYKNSNLGLINPLLSIKYNLYEIEYKSLTNEQNRKSLILIDGHLDVDEVVKIKIIGKRLIYGQKKENNEAYITIDNNNK